MPSDAAGGNPSSGAQRRNSFVWSEAFSVGVPEIDGDHQILFDLAGQIVEAATGQEVEAVTGSVLAALSDYADYHFEREERVMRAVNYPAIEAHRGRHDQLRAEVERMARRYRTDPDAVAAGELAAFVVDWLIHHILDEDMGYRPYAAGNLAAGAAAASVGTEFFMTDMEEDLLPFGPPRRQP